jgi:hypothetical protein
MKYEVQLKSTVTWWVTVEIECTDDLETAREIVADEATSLADPEQRAQAVADGRADWGPIELAYEELDESVRVKP